jgi:hypothetical protein
MSDEPQRTCWMTHMPCRWCGENTATNGKTSWCVNDKCKGESPEYKKERAEWRKKMAEEMDK